MSNSLSTGEYQHPIGTWQWYATLAYDKFMETKFEEAIELNDKAIKIAPKQIHFQLYRNRGQCNQHLLRLDDALADFKRMRHRDGRELASHIYLLRGNYETGLKLNEDRSIVPQLNWNPRRRAKDLEDKHVELFEEGGYGDTIQMLRFIPGLKRIAASVSFVPRSALVALIGTMEADSSIGGERLQVALFDLMTIAGMREKGETELSGAPYLKPEWKLRGQKQIGLNWRGDHVHMSDSWRDINLEQLVELASLHAEYEFVSFQHGLTKQEERTLKLNNISIFEPRDFAETAEHMMDMAYFLTTCSAPAHLAGALGVPTYLMHAPRLEFRWGFKDTTPWYNSMRIFRGKKYGDWSDVIDAISLRLGVDFPIETK